MLWSAKLVSKEIGKSIPLHSRVVSIGVHKVDTRRIMVLNTPSHLQSRDDILQGLITGRGDRFLVPDARRHGRSALAGFAGPSRSRHVTRIRQVVVRRAPASEQGRTRGVLYFRSGFDQRHCGFRCGVIRDFPCRSRANGPAAAGIAGNGLGGVRASPYGFIGLSKASMLSRQGPLPGVRCLRLHAGDGPVHHRQPRTPPHRSLAHPCHRMAGRGLPREQAG
jgi:hypothetical protein